MTQSTYNLRRLTISTAIYFAALGIGSPLVNLYFENLGASYAQISLILVAFALTSIVTSTLYGRYSNRLGPRRYWLVAGLLIQAVAYLLLVSASGLAMATSARVLEGTGVALYTTVSLAAVGELLSDSPRKGRSMGIYRGIGSLTFAVGAISGGMMADNLSIQAAFVVQASCLALAAAVAATLRPGPQPRPALATALQTVIERDATGSDRLPRTTLPAFFLVGVVLIMTTISAASSMFPNYMSALGRSYGAIGALWALAAALELPAMYVTGLVSDRTGRPPLLAAGSIMIAGIQVLYIMAAAAPSLVFAAQFLRACGYATYMGNSMTYTVEISSEEARGRNSGVYNVATLTGQLIGVGIGGTLAQILGFSVMFAVCSVVALGATVAFLRLHAQRAPGAMGAPAAP